MLLRKGSPRAGFLQKAVLALALSALAAACGGPEPDGDGNAENRNVAERRKVSKVMRHNAGVIAGALPFSTTAPPILGDDNWHDLNNRDVVSTDKEGEAWLDIEECMRVYLFQKSGLKLSNCEKAKDTRGNPLCGIIGTMVFNKACKDKVKVQTDSAEIVLDGTWVAVTFLPGEGLSLVAVLKGKATVSPVTDAEEGVLGEPSAVPENSFYFTRPGREAGSLEGLKEREPLPLDQLTPLIDHYQLMPWIDRVNERAKADGLSPIPIKRPPRPDLTVRISLDGDSLRVDMDMFYIPVTVEVSNHGQAPASRFDIALKYRREGEDKFIPVELKLPTGGSNKIGELAAGQRSVIRGTVGVPAGKWGATYNRPPSAAPGSPQQPHPIFLFTAFVDSCRGEPAAPCRVVESNEGNNKSEELRVRVEDYKIITISPFTPEPVPTKTPAP